MIDFQRRPVHQGGVVLAEESVGTAHDAEMQPVERHANAGGAERSQEAERRSALPDTDMVDGESRAYTRWSCARGRLVCACAHMRARHRARSLWGGGAARALAVHARCAALVGIDPLTVEGRRTSDRALSFGARPWCHTPLAHGRLVCACVHMRARHLARSLWGGGAARALAARTCRTAWVGIGPLALEAAALATGLSRSVQGRGATRPRAQPTCACAQESGHRFFFCSLEYGQRIGGNFPFTICFLAKSLARPSEQKTRDFGGARRPCSAPRARRG